MRPELVWRFFWRELKRMDVLIMVLAIALAVASVVSLARFAEVLNQAFDRKGASFLAADLVLRSSQPLDQAVEKAIQASPLDKSHQTRFTTMLIHGDAMQLAAVAAVDAHYPLRGQLKVADSPFGTKVVTGHGPGAGSIWLDSRLAQALGAKLGDKVELGYASLKVERFLIEAPDLGLNLFATAPPALMNEADLAATKVIQPGSRVGWRWLFRGDAKALKQLEARFKDQLPPGAEFTDIHRSNSPIGTALDRARRFLLLSSLLGVLLAAVAIGVAARRFCDAHVETVALIKALGGSRNKVVALFAGQMGLVLVLGSLLGLALGLGLVQGLLAQYGALLPAELPPPTAEPLWLGMAVGALCTAAFAAWPLWRLLKVPPIRVWREGEGGDGGGRTHYLLVLAALFGVIYLFTGDLNLTWAVGAGVGAAALAVGLCSYVLLRLLGRTRSIGGAWRLAVAGLQRRRGASLVQLGSFTLALMLMLLVQLIQHDLLADWQKSLPDDAPNYFVVNVAPDEVAPVKAFLAGHGSSASDLYPVVRARLTAINGEALRQGDEEPAQGKAPQRGGRVGIDRELNLTWRTDLPPQNKLVQGSWWQAGGGKAVSVEEGVAKRLGIKLGDELAFRLGGEDFSAPVTSIRKVDWQSMQPNFFMIFSPAVLKDFPASYIASFHLADDQRPALGTLLRDHPTLTLIDVDAILGQIRSLINQVALALRFVWLLVSAAALLVLLAAVQASLDERRRDLGVLRTLGASNRSLRQALGLEFLLLGGLAGLMAGLCSQLSLYLLQTRVLDLPVNLHWPLSLLALVGGALGVAIPALLRLWPLLRRAPLRLIRS
ncbi:FtsX-like permease family protein [Gallaecimonas kandeliae]|uniref:ABC transporter permease n=1 Tax=Gallaecimonas kandeliae TaxID=3029055 RepID=UPI0026478E29|nr:FtsX-like permease family protein [Gallaecimonas kandeliae]WKE64271.1 FtsX-like permease family protein [Gallaecimonas kandeliae]